MDSMKNRIIFKFLKYLAWFLMPILMKINKRYVKKVYPETTSEDYDKSSAISIDKWANKEFRTGLNYKMLTRDSKNHFGNINETMSSVFGKNERDKTLTEEGWAWVRRLDKLDKDHCNKSINLSIDYKDINFNKIMDAKYGNNR